MKRILVFAVIFCFFLAAGCEKAGNINEPEKGNEIVGIDKIEIDKDETNETKSSLISDGKLKGMQFGIGTSAAEIVSEKGKPEDEGFFAGGYYITYGNDIYFTDASYQDVQQGDYGVVTDIAFSQGKELLGVKIGMTLNEIKEMLGEPDRTFLTEEDNDFYANSKCIAYADGDYEIIFMADKVSEVTNGARFSKVHNDN